MEEWGMQCWHSEWRRNKEVDFINSGLHAEFRTRYDDVRHIMSDDPRPSWGISRVEKNRLVEVLDGGFHGELLFKKEVGREEGNRMYRDIVEISKMWNPFKQRAALDEWSKNGGVWLDESRREWVLDGQKH